MPAPLRHAICNEIFQGWRFADACRAIRKTGYTGIEIAPFTLADDPAEINAGQRREYRDTIAAADLTFVGLHWLMVSPPGLHVTASDARLRCRGWEHIRRLIDLCADLGDGGVMVFGSPKQRGTTPGISRAEATRHFVDGLAAVAQQAGDRGVTILMEALPLDQCDVVTSIEEAVALVRQIDHPAVQTMFDCHNAIGETESHASLVERYFAWIRHVHVNELDGRHPGTGSYNFGAIFDVLRRREYAGWVSLEAFEFSPGAETIARESLKFLETQ